MVALACTCAKKGYWNRGGVGGGGGGVLNSGEKVPNQTKDRSLGTV